MGRRAGNLTGGPTPGEVWRIGGVRMRGGGWARLTGWLADWVRRYLEQWAPQRYSPQPGYVPAVTPLGLDPQPSNILAAALTSQPSTKQYHSFGTDVPAYDRAISRLRRLRTSPRRATVAAMEHVCASPRPSCSPGNEASTSQHTAKRYPSNGAPLSFVPAHDQAKVPGNFRPEAEGHPRNGICTHIQEDDGGAAQQRHRHAQLALLPTTQFASQHVQLGKQPHLSSRSLKEPERRLRRRARRAAAADRACDSLAGAAAVARVGKLERACRGAAEVQPSDLGVQLHAWHAVRAAAVRSVWNKFSVEQVQCGTRIHARRAGG
eukprot:349613-Chlamydomonas_euryale.AAC.3